MKNNLVRLSFLAAGLLVTAAGFAQENLNPNSRKPGITPKHIPLVRVIK